MIDFGQCEIGRETEKAVEINIETGTGADRWQWFPKSVVEIDSDKSVRVKSWFCRQNRIYPPKQRAF